MLRNFAHSAKNFNYLRNLVRSFSFLTEFEEAQRKFKSSLYSEEPYEPATLKLYGLSQQAFLGDINEKEPPKEDILKHRKYDAWKQFKGLSKEKAQKQYIETVNSLIAEGKPREYMTKADSECHSGDDLLKNTIPFPKKIERKFEEHGIDH